MRFDTPDDENIEVQMTPMIDCVFLLLIFFLVATVMKKIDNELKVDLPESAAAIEVQKENELLVIGIDTAGKYYIDGANVGIEMLHGKLREVSAISPNYAIRIDADKTAVMQHLIHILDLCKFEGLKNIGIHTRSESAKKRAAAKSKGK